MVTSIKEKRKMKTIKLGKAKINYTEMTSEVIDGQYVVHLWAENTIIFTADNKKSFALLNKGLLKRG